MLQEAQLSAERVERALETVYSLPAFAPPPRSAWRELLGRAWSAVREWIGSLLPAFDLSAGGERALLYVVVGLLCTAAAVITGYLLVQMAALWRGRTRRPVLVGTPAAADPAGNSSEFWSRRAAAAAAAGRWREAALALYQELVLRLEHQRLVRYHPAKTPGEYRRELRRGDAGGAAATGFDIFLRQWEPIAFGGQPADAEAITRLRSAAARDAGG